MSTGARKLLRKLEPDATLPGSGGHTRRNIGRTVIIPDSDVVAPTANHEKSLDEAGALSKTMDSGSLKSPWREAVATKAIVAAITPRHQLDTAADVGIAGMTQPIRAVFEDVSLPLKRLTQGLQQALIYTTFILHIDNDILKNTVSAKH